MLNTYKYGSEKWIDVANGTSDEIHRLMDMYNIHPFIAKELTSLTPKPRIEFHDEYIYCILHFPVWKHTHNADSKSQEVDFIIGRDTLITARYDTIDALHRFSKDLEVNQILDKRGDKKYRPSHNIFVGILRGLYNSLFEELEHIEDVTEDITLKIFQGKEKEMVARISEVTRTLIDFKRVTDLHREILEALRERGAQVFGGHFGDEMEAIIVDYMKLNTTIKSSMEMLRELRDTNDSLLTSKQNETIKHLTGIGAVILPLNLIAWVFAMRTEGMPLIHNPNAFWIVIGMMVASSLLSLTYAKHKGWL
jgi:magnesium transporter